MLLSFILVIASVYGLGFFCPIRQSSLGIRLTFGWALLVVLLSVGTALLGFPVRIWSFVVVGLAAMGLAFGFFNQKNRHSRIEDIKNPGAILALIASAVFVFSPNIYLPVAWDEFSNWLGWARIIFSQDNTIINALGYTLGWPLLMAYPQAFVPTFEESLSYPAIVALHISVLTLVADFFRRLLQQWNPDNHIATLAAWSTIALLLAAQAMWVFFPTLLLIEKPQIYAFVSTLILAAKMTEVESGSIIRWSVALAVVLSAAYLIKVAGITLIPAIGILALVIARLHGIRTAVLAAAIVLAPIFIISVWWGQTFSSSVNCLSNPISILVDAGNNIPRAERTTRHLVSHLGAYYAGYKPAVTIAATVGFLLFIRHRLGMWSAAMFLAVAAVYMASMLLTYIGCMDDYFRETLMSTRRFGRVILRVFHTFGLVFLSASVFGFLHRNTRLLHSGKTRTAAVAVLILFFGWQAFAAQGGLIEVATRAKDGERGVITTDARRGNEIISQWVANRQPAIAPTVLIIAQETDGFYVNISRYHALGSRRGNPQPKYIFMSEYRFAPVATTPWDTAKTPGELLAMAEKADVVWPVSLDAYARSALSSVLDKCPDRSILTRRTEGWDCLPFAPR